MKKHHIIGIIASFALIGLYFLTMILLTPFNLVLLQFKEMWYWILMLAIGFGIQVGLFTFIRTYVKNNAATKTVAATGTMSTGSMIACCAHHLTDVLPVIGLSAAALFMQQYQTSLLLLGIFSNLVGILLMIRIIKNSSIETKSVIINKIASYNLNFMIKLMVLFGLFAIIISIGYSIRGGF